MLGIQVVPISIDSKLSRPGSWFVMWQGRPFKIWTADFYKFWILLIFGFWILTVFINDIQCGSEYRTSQLFKWLDRGWMPNGLVFKMPFEYWTAQPFEIWTNGHLLFSYVPFEIRTSKSLVFKWSVFRFPMYWTNNCQLRFTHQIFLLILLAEKLLP